MSQLGSRIRLAASALRLAALRNMPLSRRVQVVLVVVLLALLARLCV